MAQQDYGIWEDKRKPQAKKRPDGRWVCIAKASAEFPMDNGRPKQFKRIGDTKDEAQEEAWKARNKWEREQRLNITNSKKDKVKTLGILMKEHLLERLRHQMRLNGKTYSVLTDSTYTLYTQVLDRVFYKTRFARNQPHNVTMALVENYVNMVHKERDHSTYNNMRVCLNSLFADLYERGLIAENYMQSVRIEKAEEKPKKKAKKEFFTDEDIRVLYEAFKADKGHRHRQYPAYILMIETGIRQGELFAIRRSNVDRKNMVLLIESAIARRMTETYRETGQGKKYELFEKSLKNGDEYRLIKLSQYSMEAIDAMEEQLRIYCRHNPLDLLFPICATGGFNNLSNFEINFKKDCERLGIERPTGYGPHKARHTFITITETRTDANSAVIRQMTGHKGEAVHMVYTHQDVKTVHSVKTPMEVVILPDEEPAAPVSSQGTEAEELRATIAEMAETMRAMQERIAELEGKK